MSATGGSFRDGPAAGGPSAADPPVGDPAPADPPAGRHGDAHGDSAGTPWAGRTLAPTPFAGDDGSVDPGLDAALRAPAGPDLVAVQVALMTARVFAAVVAVAGDVDAETGADLGADMALPVLRSPDGRDALPLFTTVAALTAWHPGARPVPVAARTAALSAVQEERQLLVVDPAGPVTAVLPRPALWALVQGLAWTPSPQDPEVQVAVARALVGVPGLVTVRCLPGTRAELRVVLGAREGLDATGLEALTSAAAAALAADAVVAERVDGLELAVEPVRA